MLWNSLFGFLVYVLAPCFFFTDQLPAALKLLAHVLHGAL